LVQEHTLAMLKWSAISALPALGDSNTRQHFQSRFLSLADRFLSRSMRNKDNLW
jgi:hypothetical protein